MANEQNLVPMDKRTEDEQREIARAGGIASGKARKQRKTLKELLELVADKKVQSDKIRKTLSDMGIDDEDMTNQMAIAVRIALGAVNGDHKSVAEFMDGTGQKIVRNVNENHNIEYKPLIDLTKRKKNGVKKDEENQQ